MEQKTNLGGENDNDRPDEKRTRNKLKGFRILGTQASTAGKKPAKGIVQCAKTKSTGLRTRTGR